MNKRNRCFLLSILIPLLANAQLDTTFQKDSTFPKQLDNVIVIGQQSLANKKTKILSSLDGYLESNNAVNMIKRGAYAWEPLLNGMATERSVITIDGMRIYGACTDKMDPATSYVEITNLSKVNIHSGQSGSANGATIAGAIDLVRRQSSFSNSGFKGSVFTGMESSNMQKIAGTTLQYASEKIFTDFDFTYRDAGNYKAGGGEEVLYSQFTKYNASAIMGWKLSEHRQLTASAIYDRATDVGYPALPMDVSLAEAFMGSVQYQQHHLSPTIDNWGTKLYYNSVTHIMDDSKRPDVPIRMDMPGWTKTGGFYSKLNGSKNNQEWMLNLSGHYNTSLAEMTMYSNNPNEKDMFMLTWPGVHTLYSSLFFEDKITINPNWNAAFSIGSGIQNNKVKKELGLESLRIFYPGMESANTRWLKNVSAKINYQQDHWQHSFGIGYGERAPSVSEGYGFYLFNSFDRFDYIGNPDMRNEKSLELNAASSFTTSRLSVKIQADYFKIFDYIIGKPHADLIAMTIGANGVKIYEQLSRANILNTNLSVAWQLSKKLQWSAKAIYRYGKSDTLNLPFIQPFSYGTTLQFQRKHFLAEASMEGAFSQTRYSAALGETAAKAYTIFNISASAPINFKNQKLIIKSGVENIFDTYYSTFADWNRIPRMGRNIFMNLIYEF